MRRETCSDIRHWLVLVGAVMISAGIAAMAPGADAGPAEKGCVILLHGLARTHRSMAPLAEYLSAAGYRTASIDYPSTRHPVERLADDAVAEGVDACRAQAPGAPIHFVTHSMGGILVRSALSRRPLPELGRVVMIAPPNRGSEAAEALRGLPPYRWIYGPAGRQLGTGPESLPRSLGPPRFPLGVIAGDRPGPLDIWLAPVFSGPNDGKVAVDSTRLEGMHDFITVHHSHTFIMQQKDVMAQVLYFLENGGFTRTGTD